MMLMKFPSVAIRNETRIDRRSFLGSSLAAASLASLSAGRVWADAVGNAIPDSVAAITSSGQQALLMRADIKDFRASMRGQLLLANDAGYEQARKIWNGAFDRHPALIARCAGSADVIAAVNFARSHGLLTAVRAGGHSLSGQSSCEGGLMIDLSPMQGIRVDPIKKAAAAQAGVLLGDFDRESQAFGLATTLGTAADTGIAGLTLGGGLGRLMRKYGLACDNLRSVDIVTADGKLLHANERENADLFWGVRGGGGNFGVVTNFDYQLHTFGPKLLAGNRVFLYSQARTVLPAFMELMEHASEDLNLSFSVTRVPPAPDSPPGPYVALEIIYTGDPNNAERVLEPFNTLGKPFFDDVAVKSYLLVQLGITGTAPSSLPSGLRVYTKQGFLNDTSTKFIDEMLRQFEASSSWVDGFGFGQMGGAVSRIKPEATAYWNRQAKYMCIMHGHWTDAARDAANVEEARHIWQAIEPFTKGFYVNTDPSADERRLRATYGDNYPRLVKLKNKYDPTNLFRLNANIKPSV